MLSTDEFKAWAKNYVLFGHITTKIENHKNDGLLGEKGGGGFPYVVSMNSSGNVLSKLSGRSVEGFATMMKSAEEFTALETKAEKTMDDEVKLLSMKLELGHITVDAARKKADEIGVSGQAKKTLEAAFVDADIMKTLRTIRSKEASEAAAVMFYEMCKKGQLPTSQQAAGAFYPRVINQAKAAGDAETFKVALDAVRKLFAGNAQAMKWVEAREAELKAMNASDDDDGEDHGDDDDDAADHDGDDDGDDDGEHDK